MTMNSKQLSTQEFRQTFTRSCTLDAAWNYERQQHMNFCYMMIPALRRIYKDNPEGMREALKRHLEFEGCTPHIVTLLAGIMIAMEEEHASDPQSDGSTISAVKTSLMGPLSGIGDSLIWGTLLTIAVGVGTSLAATGNIAGPILFALIINVPCFILRYRCLKIGYESGTKFFGSLASSGMIEKITSLASILGLLVIGSMIAQQISFETVLTLSIGGTQTPVQDYFKEIMPALLPFGLFWVMYMALGRNIKPPVLLAALVIFGCMASFFGIC